MEKLGLNHVRGLLLYGPPGTGKTLIARKLSENLHSRPPKIVNGPEVFSMWVGQSEEHVRKLFEHAEREYQAVGDRSRLHVIIFDEFDVICPNRDKSSHRVDKGVVNQLLSKMDGVHQLNNILIIALTNRKDLIDPAVLRPGRIEVQLEIALPDVAGRRQILDIHTRHMRGNGMLAEDVDLERLSTLTANYTGAELAGAVRAAQSMVLNRMIDSKEGGEGEAAAKEMKLTMRDFELAIEKDVKPAFGSSLEDLQKSIGGGIVHWHDGIQRILDTGADLISRVNNSSGGSSTSMASLLLVGERYTGKTALAAHLALQSHMPLIRMITPESLNKALASKEVYARCKAGAIQALFEDEIFKSPASCVILDNFECLVGKLIVGGWG